MKIGGHSLGRCRIRLGDICRGHGGPVPGHWLWNFTAPLAEHDGRDEPGYRSGRGKHMIEIRCSKAGDLESGGIIVTNDLGFLP